MWPVRVGEVVRGIGTQSVDLGQPQLIVHTTVEALSRKTAKASESLAQREIAPGQNYRSAQHRSPRSVLSRDRVEIVLQSIDNGYPDQVPAKPAERPSAQHGHEEDGPTLSRLHLQKRRCDGNRNSYQRSPA